MTPAYRIDDAPVSREAFYAIACDPGRHVVVEACAGAGKTWMLVSRILRALLGMDMKLAQYERGAAFVGSVVEQVGMDAFNTIWTSPQTLPTRAETTDPDSWIRRVLG